MLNITKEVHHHIITHSKESYPHECCGLLVGKPVGENRKNILRAYRVENMNKERACDRYEISPKDYIRVDREARENNWDVLGIYHSHPDHPDRPSETDREIASPAYSYLIVSVKEGSEISMKSWVLEDDDKAFEEEKIEITN